VFATVGCVGAVRVCRTTARLLVVVSLAALLPVRLARAVPPEAVERGRDRQVRSIAIRGNDVVSTSTLRDAMLTEQRPWYMFWRFWRPRPPFDPAVFRQDVARIGRVYRNEGFYHAQVTADVALVDSGDLVDLTIEIDEGPSVHVRSVDVDLAGEPLPQKDRDVLLASLPIAPGQVFEQERYSRAATMLHAWYREHGFARVKVDRKATVDVRNDTADVHYRVESGPATVFGPVEIVGTERVDPDVIRKEVAYREGRPFRQSRLDSTRSNLLALRLFRTVRIIEEGGDGDAVVPTRIEVAEGPSHEVTFGIGYDTEEQVRGIASWRDYNFFGGARQLGVTARGSFINRTIAADFVQPHFPGPRDRLRVILSEVQEEEETYTNDRSRFSPRLEFRPLPILTPYVFYRIEYDALTDVNDAIERRRPGLAPSNSVLSGLGFGVDLNTTDDPLDPRRGWTASIVVEPVGGILGGEVDFFRLIVEGRRYQPLFWRIVLALRTRIGLADPLEDDENIPLFERFYAGGTNSVRGYERRHVGPFLGGDPIGGRSLAEVSVELRRPITETIGGSVFVDAGQVSRRSFDLPFDDLDVGVGFGASYKTPVGPLRVDLGFPLDRPRGDAGWQIHLSLGQAF
jgi:outer membrane protein insertion porin family/translocation and assembly module TamA